MKHLILLLTPLFVFATQSTLTPSEHNSIHGYNNRPIVKMGKKQKMHQLHKVDEQEAIKIVKNATHEDVARMKLIHSGNILKYKVTTKSYLVEINALDGEILKKIIRRY
ncbi:MAG: PepSY domain-containing protein [Sulfurimonas sp.]|nr:PepSY domain-containing protein [Sulfurimonas sp.]